MVVLVDCYFRGNLLSIFPSLLFTYKLELDPLTDYQLVFANRKATRNVEDFLGRLGQQGVAYDPHMSLKPIRVGKARDSLPNGSVVGTKHVS